MSDDPRIVHVASELSVPLGPEAENDGNREYVIDVIAAVDYANEMCDMTYEQGQRDERERWESLVPGPSVYGQERYEQGQRDEREKWEPMVQALTDELLAKSSDMSMGAQYLAGVAQGQRDALAKAIAAVEPLLLRKHIIIRDGDFDERVIAAIERVK